MGEILLPDFFARLTESFPENMSVSNQLLEALLASVGTIITSKVFFINYHDLKQQARSAKQIFKHHRFELLKKPSWVHLQPTV